MSGLFWTSSKNSHLGGCGPGRMKCPASGNEGQARREKNHIELKFKSKLYTPDFHQFNHIILTPGPRTWCRSNRAGMGPTRQWWMAQGWHAASRAASTLVGSRASRSSSAAARGRRSRARCHLAPDGKVIKYAPPCIYKTSFYRESLRNIQGGA